MTPHDTMRRAIDWLDQNGGAHIADELRSALAQQGEQPVAWMYHDKDGFAQVLESGPHPGFDSTPLYAAAPAAQPQHCQNPGRCAFPFCSCGGSNGTNA